MNDFLNKKFYVSISTNAIEDKNKDIWGKLTYQKQLIRLSELRDYISNNYAFCGVFTSETFSVKEKTENNWLQTNIICVDLDDRKLNYNDFMAIIQDTEICPNIAYRTANDGIKGNRYRLIYALEDSIINSNLYKEIYWGLIRKIEEITNEKNTDNCCQSVAQQICGTIHKDDIYFNDLYFDIKTFKELFGIKTLNNSDLIERQQEKGKKPKMKNTENQEKQIEGSFDFSDFNLMYAEFADDFLNLPFADIINKYNGKYYNMERSLLQDVPDDTAYIDIPKEYTEIKRYWFQTENAINSNKCSQIRKIKDGMQRRKKLYVNAIIRRLIYSEISFDNLLYNLVFELYHYMINDGNKITKSDLYEICKRAFNADLSLPKFQKYVIGNKEKKYIVNTAYCVKHNISKNAAKNIAEKQRNYNIIGEYYDLNLKDKENLQIMKENGVKVSISTLKRWKDENGLTHKRKKVSSKTINIKEEKRNIYNLNDTFSNDDIKEENESNNTNTIEVRVKPIKRICAIKRKRSITSKAEEKENNVIKAL
jgi:hypothetical protein